jgi:hypothetical protein
MAGILRTDTIQNSNTSTIITQTNSTTITIGTTGQTVALASGASSSGFGATYNGAVNWDTTPKTTTVTAASGVGYFINTTSAGVTVNLPAGTAGSIVALSDYAATWNTNSVTVNANGTDKIGGIASAPATLNTQGQAVTFVYVDSTQGWTNVGDATKVAGNAFVAATGGTITTCGNYKIHTFTGPGTFTVTNAGVPTGSNSVEYLVVAGGGGGGGRGSGAGGGSGGGAGGYRQNYPSPTTAGLPVTATSYPITVGAAGTGGGSTPGGATINNATSGSNSIFSTITSAGGGGGRGGPCGSQGGVAGGSGSGASGGTPGNQPGGAGNTPPVSPSQGNTGGSTGPYPAPAPETFHSAGGGGAGSAGGNAQPGPRAGGSGSSILISGSPVTYSTGGSGGTYSPPTTPGTPQPANSGNGGPGASGCGGGGGGGTGGSGIVIIRYKFQ